MNGWMESAEFLNVAQSCDRAQFSRLCARSCRRKLENVVHIYHLYNFLGLFLNILCEFLCHFLGFSKLSVNWARKSTLKLSGNPMDEWIEGWMDG